MDTFYTFPDGSKIRGFFWSDYYTGQELIHIEECFYEYDTNGNPIIVQDIRYPNKKCYKSHVLKIRQDSDRVHYILWKGQRVNLEDWDYHCIPILIEEIEYGKKIKDNCFIHNSIILASLMKQPNKFGVMIPPRYAKFIFPGTSFGIIGDADKEKPIAFIPECTKMRPLEKWNYKIRFVAQDLEIRQYTASEEYYFSDFCSLLKRGYLKLFEIGA